MTRRRRNAAAAAADDSYQLDAVVSLFAMILVILVTTAAASSIGPTLFNYRSRDAQADPIAVQSLAAPYPRQDTWVLRQNELLRLDYDAAARLLAQAPTQHLAATDPISGADITLIPDTEGLGGFETFEILLPTSPLSETGGLFPDMLDPDSDLSDWAARPGPVRVLATGSGIAQLPAVTRAAEVAGRPMSVRFIEGNVKISERRTAQSFTFQGVLRAY